MGKKRYDPPAFNLPDSESRHETRQSGTIVKITREKGYGFISDGKGVEYFFHRSGVRNAQWDTLQVPQPVTFIVRPNPKGPRAEDVVPD